MNNLKKPQIMKKIFALALSLGTLTAAFAQDRSSNRNESRDVILGKDNRSVAYNDNTPRYDGRERENRKREAIAQINREYDGRIAAVRKDRCLKEREKDRRIQQLQKERSVKIREVMDRFDNDKYGRYDGRKF